MSVLLQNLPLACLFIYLSVFVTCHVQRTDFPWLLAALIKNSWKLIFRVTYFKTASTVYSRWESFVLVIMLFTRTRTETSMLEVDNAHVHHRERWWITGAVLMAMKHYNWSGVMNTDPLNSYTHTLSCIVFLYPPSPVTVILNSPHSLQNYQLLQSHVNKLHEPLNSLLISPIFDPGCHLFQRICHSWAELDQAAISPEMPTEVEEKERGIIREETWKKPFESYAT